MTIAAAAAHGMDVTAHGVDDDDDGNISKEFL